jgi:protein phosphatase
MIPSQRAHLNVAALSDAGMTGKNNEDSFGVSSFFVSETNPTPVVFAVVSDGIGGHHAGEVASAMVVDFLSNHIAESNGGNPGAIFQKGFYAASEAIQSRAQERDEFSGMGATCVCALIIGASLYMAWAGDSRIYLVRGNKIQRLSTDHTWVQEAMEKGILSPEMAAKHPNQHVIRRYMGSAQPPAPDMRLRLRDDETDAQALSNQGATLRAGDMLLLCTDGLTDLVKDNEILAYMQTRNLSGAAQNLVSLANSRGGHDNITVVLLAVPETGKQNWLGWLLGE